MQQPVTADYIAGKLYRFFVRQDLSPELQKKLGSVLRDSHYEIAPLLETIFLSRDFYSPASVGTQIKSPVELAVSTYKKLGLENIPGVPDFNSATTALGQRLFSPPTVAGWAGGRSWITPGLLLERGNFARDVLFPDINFVPPDRVAASEEVRRVADRVRQGLDITTATKPDTKSGVMAESNMAADRDEDFNTRYGSFRGSQLALERVKPIPRDTAQVHLARMVLAENPQNTTQVVDYLIRRFMRVPPSDDTRRTLIAFLDRELGTSDISVARTLSRRTVAVGPAPDHEPARVSIELRSTVMKLNRREVLRAGLSGLSMTAGTALRVGVFGRAAAALAAEAESNGKILVVLELSGGNDGLNTLVPYADDAYYKHRPKIGIPKRISAPSTTTSVSAAAWSASSASSRMENSPSSTAAATTIPRSRISRRWRTGIPRRPTAASNTAGSAALPIPSRPTRPRTFW